MASCARMRRVLRLLIAAAVAYALVTYVALELNDVARLRTKTDTNSWRETHVWVANGEGGTLWLEAATPTRAWLLDLQQRPDVELDHGGTTATWRAVPVDGPEAQALVRSLLREKYGWADRWVGLLQDTSQAVPVRLDPR